MITSLSVVIIAQNDKKYKWEHSEAERRENNGNPNRNDINAHSPTNDEMCKIITGKNISDFAHELQINPKYDYLFDKTA